MSDLTLTKEQEQALLGLAPIGQDVVMEFMPPCYMKEMIPESVRPIFKIKPMSRKAKRDMVKAGMKASKGDAKDDDIDQIREFVRPWIVGFERLYDPGKKGFLEWKTESDGYMDRDIFYSIPVVVMNQIGDHLLVISGLKEQELQGLG